MAAWRYKICLLVLKKYFMAHVEKNINNKIISLYKLCAILYSVNWDHKERPLERKQVYA